MKKAVLKQIKYLLLTQKEGLLEQFRQEISVDTEGDEIDEIQGNMLIEMTKKLSTRNAAKLAQIEAALKRIEDRSYGICLDCEEPIPEKRLLSNPHFQTCVGCAEEREAKEKKGLQS